MCQSIGIWFQVLCVVKSQFARLNLKTIKLWFTLEKMTILSYRYSSRCHSGIVLTYCKYGLLLNTVITDLIPTRVSSSLTTKLAMFLILGFQTFKEHLNILLPCSRTMLPHDKRGIYFSSNNNTIIQHM